MMKNKLKNSGLVIPGTYDLTFKAIMQNSRCFNYLVEILIYVQRYQKVI